MKHIYLIDFENVADDGLTGFSELSSSDEVDLFYTDKANRIKVDFVDSLLSAESRAKMTFIKVSSGNQALDLQLATFLGGRIEKDSSDEIEYIIVSKDKGFQHVVSFWKNRLPQIRIRIQKNLLPEPDPEPAAEAELPDPAEPVEQPVKKPVAKRKQQKQPAQEKAAPPQEDQAQKAAAASNERARLNNQIQSILSKAKYDTAVISYVASFAARKLGEPYAKKGIYQGIIKQYGQKQGLEIYNLIKKEIK